MKNPLVFIPTYNESENVRELCAQLLQLKTNLDILFMDDNSPDGTGAVIDELARQHSNVNAVHRTGKLGVGSAHYDGIQWAYDHGYSRLITMDCDFTHPPHYILDIIQVQDADVVVGSRYMKEQSLRGWNFLRKTLTRTGHFLTKTLLGMSYDATGGFRMYCLDRLPRALFPLVGSKGYSFFFESLYVIHFNKFKIREIPISLPPRTYGHSKMTFAEVKRSVKLLFSIYMNQVFYPERFLLDSSKAVSVNPALGDPQGWEDYWKEQKLSTGGILYDGIAAFYRKFIIKRTLNYFVRKYFKKGSQILHAGCGSGQVDTDISQHVSITGLDISVNALRFYGKVNPSCSTLHGSIFSIPLPDCSVDGIYNLGVMEHFTEADISKIFAEFRRILKPDGRMIIFWPPEFGASVIFLKIVKWVLENLFRKKGIKIHPDEITRVQSKKHVTQLFQEAGFTVNRYYFGLLDFFTYSVIVADNGRPLTAAEPEALEPTV